LQAELALLAAKGRTSSDPPSPPAPGVRFDPAEGLGPGRSVRKVTHPFVLLPNASGTTTASSLEDRRRRVQEAVFRPGYNLPTMTLDEFVADEMRRGNFLQQAGPQGSPAPKGITDEADEQDRETMKARGWDEFKEGKPVRGLCVLSSLI
jgi:hypothetical protein